MTDITLTTTDLELVTITINAVLLLGLGLVMIYAKRLEAFGARLSAIWNRSQFRSAGTSGIYAVGLHVHS